MKLDLCLQINLSPGDIAYAEQTVPHLVETHRKNFRSSIAVLDCHKPQVTKANTDGKKYAEPEFSKKCEKISQIAQQLKVKGCFDEIFEVHEQEQSFVRNLYKKYMGNAVSSFRTHDYYGAALLAYWTAMEVPSAKYVLHYDADILLCQKEGFDWVEEAIDVMESEEGKDIIFATPRVSPPGFEPDAPSAHEGRPFSPCSKGWFNDWFSTRCFLLKKERLTPYLPLCQGFYFWELLFYRLIRRRYPQSPELMLFRSAGERGAKRLNLSSENAWILHPTSKPRKYLELLPQIMKAVSEGRVPPEQMGCTEVKVEAWEEWFEKSSHY